VTYDVLAVEALIKHHKSPTGTFKLWHLWHWSLPLPSNSQVDFGL